MALLDWTLAGGLGLLLAAGALWLFSHQAQMLKAALARHAQEREMAAVLEVIRSELRSAGQRGQSGPSAAHDQLKLEEGKTPSMQYLCDRCGSPDRARAAGFRLQDGVMGQRSLGATAHQALNDPHAAAVRRWRVTQGQTEDCSPWIQLQLEVDPATAGGDVAWTNTVRPRNLGPLPCEASGLPPPPLEVAGESARANTLKPGAR